jgi:predicted ATPase
VCGDASLDDLTVFDLLTSLVEKSLVQTETSDTWTRYRILESTRQYARELLQEQGEYEAAAGAHAAAFLAKAEELDDAYETMSDEQWAREVQVEIDNWRTALEWGLIASSDVTVGQRLAGALR